jgi:hypothetical protein
MILRSPVMPTIDPAALESFETLLFGIAAAGLIGTGFELLTARKASFRLLEAGGPAAVASVPLIVFSAPFIIMRNTLRGRRFERRPVGFVALATVISGLWALACGRVLLDLFGLVGG